MQNALGPYPEVFRSLRATLDSTTTQTSRMAAATIGGHLDLVALWAGKRPGIAVAVDGIRDATLRYLTALHGRGEVVRARRTVLMSIDHLEATLVLLGAGQVVDDQPIRWAA